MLSSSIYFTQGIEGLPSQGLFYYLKETLHFSPQKIMVLSSITIFAWLFKPFIGYLIDNFLSKKIWIFIALGFDLVLTLLLGLLALPFLVLGTMIVLNSANSAFRDVAVDGIMCVEGKKEKVTGKIQSIQWISISVAGLLSGVLGGIIAEKWGYQKAFLFLVPVYILVGIAASLYREEPRQERQSRAENFQGFKKLFTNKNLLVMSLFIFLYKYSPSFGTPLFFIQRDTFKWGKVWIGTLGSIGTVFAIIGSLLYYRFSQKINIKKWLYASVFLGALTSLSYLYYTPITAVCYDIIYSFIGMFIFLMVMDFMARCSVKGFEATSFAFLCSVSNLALVTSNLSGAFLLPKVGLSWLIVLSAVTSFLCLPLIKKIEV